MSRKRASAAPSPVSTEPQYAWALDLHGHPTHISHADRGEMYTCPVCHGKMIAKRGELKQHHYAHDHLQLCTPEKVARVAARRWLTLELQRMAAARQSVIVSWPCPLCKQTHSANLLHDVDYVVENHTHDDVVSDVALLNADRAVLAAILLTRPTQEMLFSYAQRGVTALATDAAARSMELTGVATFLAGAQIYGGLCTTQRDAADSGVITDMNALRDALTAAVANPPHSAYGALDVYRNLTHVFTLGEQKLWLPPILWLRAVGGLHHAINPALQVVTQEWEQPDGATIALYYVTVRDEYAIAVRRFPAGEPVTARLQPGALHGPRLSALSVAQNFAEG